MRFLYIAAAMASLLVAQEIPPPADVDQFLAASRKSYAKSDYNAARQALELAWTLVSQTPPANPQRYDVLKGLASATAAVGQYKEARDYMDQAVNWREVNFGKEDPQVLDDLTEIAMLSSRIRDYARGLAVLIRVYSAHIQALGFESSAAADDQSRMALLYMGDRKADRAAECLITALRIREKLLGTEHPGLLVELDRLADAWIVQREYGNAEAVFRRTLRIRERLAGLFSPDLIPTVEGLAYALFGEKQYPESEINYKRLLSLWMISAGPDHPMVSLTLDKMAVFYREQKRMEEAQAVTDQSIAIRALFLANGLATEAGNRLAKDDRKEAERIYRRALAVLDPERKEHDELRKTIEQEIEKLIPPKPTGKSGPARPPGSGTTGKKQF